MPVATLAFPDLRHLLNRWSYGATPALVSVHVGAMR